jgi:MFS family permease
MLLWAIAFATPFFVVFGSWSDRVGRKWIMLGGMFLGLISYRSIYQELLDVTNDKNKVEVVAEKTQSYESKLVTGTADSLTKTITIRKFEDGAVFKETKTDTSYAEVGKVTIKPTIKMEKTLGSHDYRWMIFLVFIQIIFVTMVYGPIAAFLVEMFPTQIRYTSMSLPYHIGNGVFGGLVPFISTLIIEYTKTPDNPAGQPLAGLWYPMSVAAICLIIGIFYLSNKIDQNVKDEENAYIHHQ